MPSYIFHYCNATTTQLHAIVCCTNGVAFIYFIYIYILTNDPQVQIDPSINE